MRVLSLTPADMLKGYLLANIAYLVTLPFDAAQRLDRLGGKRHSDRRVDGVALADGEARVLEVDLELGAHRQRSAPGLHLNRLHLRVLRYAHTGTGLGQEDRLDVADWSDDLEVHLASSVDRNLSLLQSNIVHYAQTSNSV